MAWKQPLKKKNDVCSWSLTIFFGLNGQRECPGLQERPSDIHACALLLGQRITRACDWKAHERFFSSHPTKCSYGLCRCVSSHGECLVSRSECGLSELLDGAPVSVSMYNLNLGLGSTFQNSQNQPISLTRGSSLHCRRRYIAYSLSPLLSCLILPHSPNCPVETALSVNVWQPL